MASLLCALAVPRLASAAPAPIVTTHSAITAGVNTPVRAALDQLGTIYVTDPRGGGILQYNNAGKLLRKIAVSNPMGIALAQNGDLLVSQGASVAAINPATGSVSATFGTFGKANGIAVDQSGFVYVTDSLNNCVQVFNAAYAPITTGKAAPGKPLNSFGTNGTQNGQFLQPTGITYEKSANQLAVVDTLNGRVQFFSTSGTYQKTLGSFGVGPLKFTSPQAIAFEYNLNDTALSRIYVADTFQSNVQVIDAPSATFVRYIGSYGLGGGKLVTPGDVVLDRSDSLNKRLIITNGSGALTIFGIDNGVGEPSVGPLLTINSVPLATNLTALAISGTTDSGATVTVNGTAATVVGTSWSSTVTLVEGFNLLTVIASNSKGSTVKTVSVTALPPATNPVALTINPIPAMTAAATITISGTVTTGASVTINGTAATVTDTSWALPVTLTPGSNNFLIIASKATLSDATASINITLDNTAPVLTAFLPPNGTTTSNPLLSLAGTVIDDSPTSVTVTINNSSQTLAVSDTTFSLALALAGGTNVVSIIATDAAGNKSSIVSSTLIYNPLDPLITLTTPSGGVSGSPNYTIAGTAPANSTVTINGQPVTLTGSTWTTSVSLVPGVNYFTITATGPDGLSSTVVVTVFFGPTLPTIAITNPTQDMATSESTFTLDGTVSGSAVVTAMVNGAPLPVSMTGNGSFTLTLPSLTIPGNYLVSASATDTLGNTATTNRTIMYDPTMPVITVVSLNPLIVTSTGGVLVAKDKFGPVGSVIFANGVYTLNLTGVSYDPATLDIFSITAAGNSTRNGDINMDGVVDINDALLALQILVGLQPPASFAQMLHADLGPAVNHQPTVDGQLRMSDIVVIMERVVGLPW
jgi:uncharacterized Zn-binding protein involved in type VI secretion